MDRTNSARHFENAKKVLVGGVNSPVRSFKRVGGSPIFAKRGYGAFIEDVDANHYLDFVMSYGPHLFGHTRPEIVQAAQKAIEGSSCLGLTSEAEIEWAELLLKRVPHAEKVRALSSGTEATSTAIRLARGITGRDVIVKFAGHYHGHVDSLLVDGGSGLATLSTGQAVADSKGLPAALTALSRVLEFNDVAALKNLFSLDGKIIAGVILEPVMGNMGVVPPNLDFLKTLRELCTQNGSLLIFDEVMTGLRVHRESAQGRFGVVPDLSCFGKIVGGGFPLAALVGPAKFMDQLAPLGPVYQAGTLSGNPVAIAAGIAMLKLIDKENPYEKFENLSEFVAGSFYEAAAMAKINIRVERVGAMFSVYFRKDSVTNAQDCRAVNEKQFNTFFWAMLDEGYMLAPSPFEAAFLATVHDPELRNVKFQQALNRVFKKVSAL